MAMEPLDWNAIAARTVLAGQSPFSQARLMSIVQLAVFEAVNAITGEYESYLDEPIEAPASDGSSPATFDLPDSSANGVWQTTPSCPPAGGQFFQWQDVTPFGIASPADFLLPAPPSLLSNRYLKDYNEVKTVGDVDSTARPADRTEVARLYAVTSPSFALNMASRQIAAARGLSLADNARAFALINMSSNDSLIASFYTKYHYDYWRPETAIQRARPTVTTRPKATWGSSRSSLKQIADDVDDARVYGGIHYRFDQEGGNALGRAVATEIYKNYLRPVHGQQ